MKWNWQHKNWPAFSYDASALQKAEATFLSQSGIAIGAFRHLDPTDQDRLKVEIIGTEAYKTSEIEGEFLNRDSLQSSIQRHLGLSADNRRIPPAEEGIADLMVDLYRNFDVPLTHDTLFTWHRMLTRGRQDLQNMGSYRTHKGPMQVVSGSIYDPKVHFEAPPSGDMQVEMDAYITWFRESRTLPALTRAGIAHLYFVSIHPFEDGNGRIGRALSEKALAQSIGQPTLSALSTEIERHRKDYYDALAAANRGLEITDWLCFFADIILRAQNTTETLIDFLIQKTKLTDRLRGRLNPRQEKVLERMFREGPEGFTGGLSAKNYLSITHTSRATATRDLAELVELGALTKTGERKGTRYHLTIATGKT